MGYKLRDWRSEAQEEDWEDSRAMRVLTDTLLHSSRSSLSCAWLCSNAAYEPCPPKKLSSPPDCALCTPLPRSAAVGLRKPRMRPAAILLGDTSSPEDPACLPSSPLSWSSTAAKCFAEGCVTSFLSADRDADRAEVNSAAAGFAPSSAAPGVRAFPAPAA